MAGSDNREDLSGALPSDGQSAATNDRPERENRPFEMLVKGVLRQFANEEEYQTYVARAEKKAARKIVKKARKVAYRKAEEEKAELSRAVGEKPPSPSPCERCASTDHTGVDCPKRAWKSWTVQSRKSPLNCGGSWRKPSHELNPEPIAEASARSGAGGKRQRSGSPTPTESLQKAPGDPSQVPDVNVKSVKDPAKGGQGMGKGRSEKANVNFTRRVEKGFDPEEESIFGDGTWIWAKMPLELRPAANVPLSWVCLGLVGTGLVSHAELKVACPHGHKAWAVKCDSVQTAMRFKDGVDVKLDKHDARFSVLKTGGARGFVTKHYGFLGPDALMEALLNVQEIQKARIPFWVGIQKSRGAVGLRALVVFERAPGFASFSVPIGKPSVSFRKSFRAKFWPMDVYKSACDICTLEHPDRTVVQCPELQTLTPTADMNTRRCVVLSSAPNA
ncbi:uncharacterized protein BO80DRAFT_429700 [Aspergillus ibericus CBS 121593]|uniref:Uncharacterized protein n=1 Tax=Aspergillus ibericus CBS 121593 TaxID=1448316 RepID=A0A395GJK6_9EURO|nr:hypothetical protein BO80DRAFT_429700 [Aspergillus ibericus CBS 121593]RAK95670.1 hypothetical protein BO80DRAFT_429700 [Aspergillus ibericus CBS 121593]